MDLLPYTGIGQFGPAYEVMLRGDSHAPGSVDRVLVERMVRVCEETAEHLYDGFTPTVTVYERGSRPELERAAAQATGGTPDTGEQISGIAGFCRDLGRDAEQDLDVMRIGGTEEEIIARGSDWCTDVARIACVLCQAAGVASRLVWLADTASAYSGHVIVEAFCENAWGAVDAVTAVVYRHRDGRPATTWELMQDADLVRANGPAAYTRPEQFRAAAVANYAIAERAQYDYTVSGVNAYCRSILEMSDQGWPGGLRWLHGEDGGPR